MTAPVDSRISKPPASFLKVLIRYEHHTFETAESIEGKYAKKIK